MKREPSLYKAIAAGAGFLAALVGLIVLVLATRDSGAPEDPATLEPACLDFASQADAQSFYESEGGPGRDDHGLDADGNGVACEAMTPAQAAETVTLDDYVLTQVTATATPTTTATPRPTTTPVATTTPRPTSGVLPQGGSESGRMAVAGMSLVTTGMFGVTVYNARAYLAERRRRRDAELEEERYKLIGW